MAGKLAPSEEAMAPLLSESLTLSKSDNFPERIYLKKVEGPTSTGCCRSGAARALMPAPPITLWGWAAACARSTFETVWHWFTLPA